MFLKGRVEQSRSCHADAKSRCPSQAYQGRCDDERWRVWVRGERGQEGQGSWVEGAKCDWRWEVAAIPTYFQASDHYSLMDEWWDSRYHITSYFLLSLRLWRVNADNDVVVPSSASANCIRLSPKGRLCTTGTVCLQFDQRVSNFTIVSHTLTRMVPKGPDCLQLDQIGSN